MVADFVLGKLRQRFNKARASLVGYPKTEQDNDGGCIVCQRSQRGEMPCLHVLHLRVHNVKSEDL